MKTLVIGLFSLVLELAVVVVLPLVLLVVAGLLRFTVVTVLPVVGLFALAVASGIARTVGVGLFGVGVVLRLVMAAVDAVGARVPAPRLPVGVGR
ncbi:hypothetical protein E1202_04290 [Saccharopolyspora karakumensis]|uniref:Uncharacterized protein n=1 Tax=Saccharopolyspora karakumensis TaxID=2530386 RepID=A0A4R5BXL3_9PSEU|nr:hypothetical protein [Saccharopolyspora karakumensis]TDD91958.1 hypothetical protein E1202_04290 [Saccharopolyspora karakumensis]